MNTDRNSGPDPDKTTKHQTISRLSYFAFIAVRSARRILPKYSSQRKQKNEDGIWIHVSLFCPVQDTDFGQYLETARHESLICLHPDLKLRMRKVMCKTCKNCQQRPRRPTSFSCSNSLTWLERLTVNYITQHCQSYNVTINKVRRLQLASTAGCKIKFVEVFSVMMI